MEEFKIKNFQRDNPSLGFPTIQQVDPQLTQQIRDRISRRLGIDPLSDKLELLKQLVSCSDPISSISADDESFSLLKILGENGVRPNDEVFINWYRFDDIDRIRVIDLNNHFSDIWYLGPDSIDVFDESLDWILSVSYLGSLSLRHLVQE